jgi:hypothetical protein
MKFVAVRLVGLMTSRECWVDCPFPYHVTVVGWEPSPLPMHTEAPGIQFKLAFYSLTLSAPKRCHMDLWLSRLVLTHHHHHWHQQLPSATSCEERVSSSFFNCSFFSGVLPSSPVQFGLQIPCERSPLFQPTGPPSVRLDYILSHWSGSQMVPLTLVLRLLASAEIRLYRWHFLLWRFVGESAEQHWNFRPRVYSIFT